MRSLVWLTLIGCGSVHGQSVDATGSENAGGEQAAACGARGEACCALAKCDLRASCDGKSCIAADVWTSGTDGTFDFNGGGWIHPLLMGSTAQLPAVHGLWGTTSTFVVGVGAGGLILRFDGTDWRKDVVASTAGDLNGVAGASANDIWAVGASDHFTHYNGTSWTDLATPPTTNDEPWRAVWMSGPGEGWACGELGNIAQLHNGVWTKTGREGNGYDSLGLWGSSATDVWMVGERHSLATGLPLKIEHFDGQNWSDGAGALDPNGSLPKLNAVWGLDANNVWAVGDGGTVVFWNGQLWTQLLSGTQEDLVSVWGSGANDVWVAGSTAMHHFDGEVWETIQGLSAPPVSVWLSSN